MENLDYIAYLVALTLGIQLIAILKASFQNPVETVQHILFVPFFFSVSPFPLSQKLLDCQNFY